VKQDKVLPSGTVFTLVDYRDGKLFRYVVMEKRSGWGAEYPPEKRTGEWEFQAFNADRTVNRAENLDRCFSCHKAQAANMSHELRTPLAAILGYAELMQEG
jgi:signal transduction histidine kinase